MHRTISYQLARARPKLRRRQLRPAIGPLTKRTAPFALIAAVRAASSMRARLACTA